MKRTLKKILSGADPFFRKDGNGQEIFYPWGVPGEALYISSGQKRALLAWLYFLIFVMLGFIMLGIFLDATGRIPIALWSQYNFIFAFLLIIYFLSVCWFAKGKTFYVLPENERPSKKKIFEIFMWLVGIQLTTFHEPPPLFSAFQIVSNTLVFYTIILLWKKKGYFFSKA